MASTLPAKRGRRESLGPRAEIDDVSIAPIGDGADVLRVRRPRGVEIPPARRSQDACGALGPPALVSEGHGDAGERGGLQPRLVDVHVGDAVESPVIVSVATV